ncbi:hypothetical protein [Oceaniglobus roseus]|uniref:hypothetical protein n=1 Tax=Oceaniglobus roseus TaxID=1737570 RepID=UPI000C7EFC20|nr:hypothetical protein [Kandeliimicrobium roseum]
MRLIICSPAPAKRPVAALSYRDADFDWGRRARPDTVMPRRVPRALPPLTPRPERRRTAEVFCLFSYRRKLAGAV